MLALTGPRIIAMSASSFRKLELDAPVFARSRSVFERALRDGKERTRPELSSLLRRAGIEVEGIRLAYLVMRAELPHGR